MKKLINPWRGEENYNCFGCCPDNANGLKMQFFEDGDYIVCKWEPKSHFQGWINTLHGGIQATLADEISSWVCFRKLQTGGFTSKLEMRYRRPISSLEPFITLRAKLSEVKRNMAFIDVDILDSKGNVCTQGQAVYSTMTEQDASEKLHFRGCKAEDEC